MKFATILLAILAVSLTASAAPLSFSVCPNVDADTAGCELLINVTAVNGSGVATAFTVSTNPTDLGPFDGVEDTLLGITNSSSGALTSIFLNATGSGAFGFDGDGACPSGSYTPGPTAAECGTAVQNPTGYGSEQNTQGQVLPLTFSVGGSCGASNTDCGTVLINGSTGMASGSSTWFDLENVITATQLTGTPEPGSMMLLGSGLAGLAFFARKRRAAR
jgi:hypothetical protein